MRKFAAAAACMILAVGFVMAEEFRAVITKVDGNKVTFHRVKRGEKGKKGEKGEAETLTAAKDVKVLKGKFNVEAKKLETGDAVEGALKNEAFSKEVQARITTDADNKSITEIVVMPERKGKKGSK